MRATPELFDDYIVLLCRISSARLQVLRMSPEDLAQELRLKLHRNWSQLESDEPGAVKAWINRTLANLLNDHQDKAFASKRDIRKEQSLDEIVAASSARIEAFLPSPATTPSRALVRKENATRIRMSLAKLPEDQRLAIELQFIEVLKYDDIATRMGKSPQAVAGLLRRGMKALRDDLDGGTSSLLGNRPGTSYIR